jgi:molybdopterin synthase sulfur carrier subunit
MDPLRVQISYFGRIRMIAGVKSESFDLESGSSLGCLLDKAGSERNIGDRISGDTTVNLLINGRNSKFLDGMNTILSDGDEVSVFPPTGGG